METHAEGGSKSEPEAQLAHEVIATSKFPKFQVIIRTNERVIAKILLTSSYSKSFSVTL